MQKLFKVQDMQELNDLEKVSSTWVKHLYGVKDQLYNMETQMIGIKLKGTIELKEVTLVETYPPKDILPDDGLYQYLLQPREEHDSQCKGATDRTWSKGEIVKWGFWRKLPLLPLLLCANAVDEN